MNFVRPSLLLGSRLDLASRLDSASLAELQKEVLAEQLRAMVRRETYVRYFVRLAALAFGILIAAFSIQILQLFQVPLAWNGWSFDMIWASSVVLGAAATLLTGVQWWRAREQFVRTEIGLLQFRLQTDFADDHRDS